MKASTFFSALFLFVFLEAMTIESNLLLCQVQDAVVGYVKTKDGKPVPEANITLISEKYGEKLEFKADLGGRWKKLGIRPGCALSRFGIGKGDTAALYQFPIDTPLKMRDIDAVDHVFSCVLWLMKEVPNAERYPIKPPNIIWKDWTAFFCRLLWVTVACFNSS